MSKSFTITKPEKLTLYASLTGFNTNGEVFWSIDTYPPLRQNFIKFEVPISNESWEKLLKTERLCITI